MLSLTVTTMLNGPAIRSATPITKTDMIAAAFGDGRRSVLKVSEKIVHMLGNGSRAVPGTRGVLVRKRRQGKQTVARDEARSGF
jgi:hypothetical protein